MAGAQKVSQFPQASTVATTDEVPLLQGGVTKRVTVGKLTGSPDFGWSATGESWLFSSWNSATKIGVVTVPSDATLKYSIDNFVRFSQTTGGIKYGKIIAITATTLSLWIPTNTLINEAITAPVYSPLASPVGVPAGFARATPYRFSAYQTGNTTGYADGSFQTVLFGTELYDTNGNYNAATGEFVAPVSGYYRFHANVKITGQLGVNGLWEGRSIFLLNGTAVDWAAFYPYDHARYTTMNMRNTLEGLYLNAGDVVRMQAFGDTQSGGTWAVNGGREQTRFEGSLISQV